MAYMTPDQLRSRVPALDDGESDFSDAVLEDLVAEFTDIAERYLGVAYESRAATETFEMNGQDRAPLKWPQVTAVSSVETEGTAVTEFTFDDGYSILFDSRQTGRVEVTYTHGFTEPTPTILSACREYVRARALAERSRIPRDVISQSGDGFTTRYSTPDWDAGRPTGFVQVDALLNSVTSYRLAGIA